MMTEYDRLTDLAAGCVGQNWNYYFLHEAKCLPSQALEAILPHLNVNALEELQATCSANDLKTHHIWVSHVKQTEIPDAKWKCRIFEDEIPNPRQVYWDRHREDQFMRLESLCEEPQEPEQIYKLMNELKTNPAPWNRLTLCPVNLGALMQNLPLLALVQNCVPEICISNVKCQDIKVCSELQLLLYILMKYGNLTSLVISCCKIDMDLFGVDGEESGLANLDDKKAGKLAKALGYTKSHLLLDNPYRSRIWPDSPDSMLKAVNENKQYTQCYDKVIKEIYKLKISSEKVESVLIAMKGGSSECKPEEMQTENCQDNGCRLKQFILDNSWMEITHDGKMNGVCSKLWSTLEKFALMATVVDKTESADNFENMIMSLVRQNLTHLKLDVSPPTRIDFLPDLLTVAVNRGRPLVCVDLYSVEFKGDDLIPAELQVPFTAVKFLTLRFQNIINYGILTEILENISSLKRLSFIQDSPDNPDVHNPIILTLPLMKAVQSNKQLEAFQILGQCNLNLAETIKNLPNLKHISLCGKAVPREVAENSDFMRAITGHPNLRNVILAGNNLETSACKLLENLCLMCEQEQLQYLGLGNNLIRSKDLLRMARKLPQRTKGQVFEILSLVGHKVVTSEKDELRELFGEIAGNVLFDTDHHFPDLNVLLGTDRSMT